MGQDGEDAVWAEQCEGRDCDFEMLLLPLSLLPSFDMTDRRLLPVSHAGLLLRLLLLLLLKLALLLPLLLQAFPAPSESSFLSGVRLGELSVPLSLFREP